MPKNKHRSETAASGRQDRKTGSVDGFLPFFINVSCHLILDKGDDGVVIAGQRQLFQIAECESGTGRFIAHADRDKQVNIDTLPDRGDDPICPDNTVHFGIRTYSADADTGIDQIDLTDFIHLNEEDGLPSVRVASDNIHTMI